MEEKHVRHPDRLAVISLWLGILAIIYSPPVVWGLSLLPGLEGFFTFGPFGLAILFSMVGGFAGLATGKIAVDGGAGKKANAIGGIVLSILAILLSATYPVIYSLGGGM